jgi:hypothetical protein
VGEERWSVLALPPIVLGSTLFVILTGMEIALGAVAETGGDAQAVQAALSPWFVPILLAGAIGFALGAFGFAIGIARSAVLRPGLTRVVTGALGMMAVARFVPLSVAPYMLAVAGVVALWPLAYEMWRHSATRPSGHPRPLPVS